MLALMRHSAPMRGARLPCHSGCVANRPLKTACGCNRCVVYRFQFRVSAFALELVTALRKRVVFRVSGALALRHGAVCAPDKL